MKKIYLSLFVSFLTVIFYGQCSHQFNMYDSFGDGWNGSTYTITTSTGVIGTGGLLTGASGSDPFVLSTGDPCVTVDTYEYELTAKFYRDCTGIAAPASLSATTNNSCGLMFHLS